MRTHFTLFLLLFCFAAKSQNSSPENRIVVLGQATINVPSDQVKFNVDIVSTDSLNIDNVYGKHQKLEDKMVRLLKDLDIPATAIKYSLFSVSESQDYRNNRRLQTYYQGRQHVTFTLSDLTKFKQVQALLIKAGFTSFHSTFASSVLENHTTQVLEKAISVARAKADVMAKAANRQIKRVVKVSDTEDTDPVFVNYKQDNGLYEMVVTNQSGMNLMEFQQTIPVKASVKVVFQLK